MNPTPAIALALGVFFLVVAVVNRFRARAERRHQDDIRSAALNGGTPDAPVHLESPFRTQAAEAPAAPPQGGASAPAQPEEEGYVWD